jgi:hypothetical protein
VPYDTLALAALASSTGQRSFHFFAGKMPSTITQIVKDLRTACRCLRHKAETNSLLPKELVPTLPTRTGHWCATCRVTSSRRPARRRPTGQTLTNDLTRTGWLSRPSKLSLQVAWRTTRCSSSPPAITWTRALGCNPHCPGHQCNHACASLARMGREFGDRSLACEEPYSAAS